MALRATRLTWIACGLLLTLGSLFLGLRMAGEESESVLNLTRLPSAIEKGMVFVLLLPMGGLVAALFRLGLGIRMFGYFTAPLLGLSFMYVPWANALVMFIIMTVIGLGGMMAARRLGLAKLPRLSLLMCGLSLTLVITLSTMHDMKIEVTRTGMMLPMVALTMMMESFHRTNERSGIRAANVRLTGTLLAAAATLAVVRFKTVQNAFLAHPELLFFVAAALVVTGRLTVQKEVKLEEEEQSKEASGE